MTATASTTRRVALVALAVLVGAAGLLSGGTAGAQGDDAPIGTVWQRVVPNIAEFGGEGDQVPGDVAAGGPGFVAVGNDSAGIHVQPAVWLSDDGTDWRRVALAPEVADPDEARRFEAVAAGGGVLVAVGTEGIDCSGDFDLSIWGLCERSRPAAWWSMDGEVWNRAADVFDDAGDSSMTDVVAAADGFYAIGNRRRQANWDVDVWFSPDGRSWQRVHSLDTRWPLSAGPIANTSAGIVAFVTEAVDREVAQAAAVRRGGGWVMISPLDDDPAPANQLAAISAGGAAFSDHVVGLVADFAPVDRGGPLTWSVDTAVFALGPLAESSRSIRLSDDGVTWDSRAADLFTFAARPMVLPTTEGFTAVQFVLDGDMLTTPSWLSEDGETWRPSGVAPTPLARVDRASTGAGGVPGGVRETAIDGGTAVAIGVDATGGDADAAFWFSTAGAVPEPEPGTEAPGAGAEYTTASGCVLTAGAVCPASNLDGADLAGLAAPGADLALSNLAGANLAGANLAGADLDGADLRDADLSGANLSGASLVAASLQGATLDGSNLTDVELGHTDFTGASMRGIAAASTDFGGGLASVGAILAGADLGGAMLASADLTSIDLRDADLSSAELAGANLSGAHMAGVNLTGATVRQANLNTASLGSANMSGLVAREAAFTLADLRGAVLTGADLTNASLFGSDLRGADLTGSLIPVTNFIEAILIAATLPGSDLGVADWGRTVCPDGFVTGQPPSGSCAGHEVGG